MRTLGVISLILFGLIQYAIAATVPEYIAFEGQIIQPSGSTLEASSVAFNIKILTPANDCILFEETQTLNMTSSNGVFSLNIGAGTRTGNDKGLTLKTVFDNSSVTTSALQCSSGTSYTSQTGDIRKIKVSFTVDGETISLTESLSLGSVPYALHAETIQGKTANELVQVNNSKNLTQANIETIFNSFTELSNLITGTSSQYTKSNQLNGYDLPASINNGEALRWNSSSSSWETFTAGSTSSSFAVGPTAIASGFKCPTTNTSYEYDTFISCNVYAGTATTNGCLMYAYINDVNIAQISSYKDTGNSCHGASYSFFLPAGTTIRFVNGGSGWGSYGSGSWTVIKMGQ